WACFPRFDGDPAFCALLHPASDQSSPGAWTIELLDQVRAEQEYHLNTPILRTRLFDRHGGSVEVTDFAPRFRQHGRMFCPMMLVRQVRSMSGTPRVRIRLHPARDYGREAAPLTSGSNHVRYLAADTTLRLTTDAPVTQVLEEASFFVDGSLTLLLGPDETLQGSVAAVGRHFFEETLAYWRDWVRSLGIPFEWQDAVIRAAITLELNVFEDTGAVVAAMTTSIPEAAGSGRNWDYRYCWLRDAYFVVNALNSLGTTRTMERYMAFILNVVADAGQAELKPVYGISGRSVLDERVVSSLAGYRSMGPVRVGNQAHRQIQHDVYGSAILAATHAFFDRRLIREGNEALFHRLEPLGEAAARLFDQPDAGIWEFRGISRVHTFSSMMCWAGCDRLARIAERLGRDDRAGYWRQHAERIHEVICTRAWNEKMGSFTASLDGDTLDASLLRMHDLGFLPAEDPRFAGTVAAIERELRRGDFIFRYVDRDDFGVPETAFLACTFWYISALAALGRRQEARDLFERVLARRNRHGLLSEDVDPQSGELWGNFVQTYSMVGIVDAATRLSIPWSDAF
ncbi:MAG TPA: glycoside hydrolase family 15 protein, partial [Gemmatimonadales bacterium]|nr:glycoside hydrolase family 15 protein [Gemmatimonadales bacterium]